MIFGYKILEDKSLINSNIWLHEIQDLLQNHRSSDVVRITSDAETILGSRDPQVVETSLACDVALEIIESMRNKKISD